MEWIDRNHPVFLSEEFLKDKTKFALIVQNLESESVQLCSDGENYLLCRGKTGWPVWVWTKDQMDAGMVKEVESAMEQYLAGEGKEKFTCKKEFYELLVRDGYEKLRPDMADKPTIARYWYAANLIYSVTNMLLSKGLIPLLYTDYQYIPSNKAYKNAGYEDTGVLINFYMEKSKRDTGL